MSLRDSRPREARACEARVEASEDRNPLEIAEQAAMCGGDEQAAQALRRARRAARTSRDADAEARVEIALAALALAGSDVDRARRHLAAAGPVDPHRLDLAAHAWLVGAGIDRADGGASGDHDAPSASALLALGRGDLACEVLIELGKDARARGDVALSARLAREARAVAPSGARAEARAELAAAEHARFEGSTAIARSHLDAACGVFARLGARRDEGRALLEFVALAVPGGASSSAPAATSLGRAEALLGADATWQDRRALRRGFQTYGRRLLDKALDGPMDAHVDALEDACASLRSSVAVALDQADQALAEPTLRPETEGAEGDPARVAVEAAGADARRSLGAVERLSRGLFEIVGSALVERDRLRQLVASLAALNEGSEREAFGAAAARAAAGILEADRVVIAVEDAHAGARIVGAFGASPEDLAGEALEMELARALRGSPATDAPPAPDDAARPRDSVLVVPLQGAMIRGVLRADKRTRRGRFREQDADLAALLGQYVAAALGGLHARRAEMLTASRLRATVDAIQDGVLAADADGRVLMVNAQAARILRATVEGLVGRRLSDVTEAAPLATALAARELPDGAVVRLPHGGVVVTGRRVGDGDDGIVVTLVELDRARRIAQRIGGARARYDFDDVIGRHPSLRRAVQLARQATEIDASVLITGESGTGKEVLAQAIHGGGRRASEPFVGINCAALPRELLEAELFGYERGAFTGARSDGNSGKFELAAGGTILLDEIGDMPLDMQAMLLRVLQERVVVRLGGSQERPVRARVIATTHRDLDAGVARGTFRMDLLFRLRVIAIHLPPLRERGDDVAEIAERLLLRVAQLAQKPVDRLAPAVVDELRAHAWPGNVRELVNVIEREVSLLPADARVIERLTMPLVAPSPEEPASSSGRRGSALPDAQGPESITPLAEVERRAFLNALEHCKGNVARAAKALGVSKVTFYAKLKLWGLHRGGGDGPPSSKGDPRIE